MVQVYMLQKKNALSVEIHCLQIESLKSLKEIGRLKNNFDTTEQSQHDRKDKIFKEGAQENLSVKRTNDKS